MSKLGLALSGGGIKGMAHLGVLQYLTELGIRPSVIAGTSAGALAGAFYAAGFEPKEILEIGKTEKFFNYSNLLKRQGVGLFSSDVFGNIIKKYIPKDTLEALEIPLLITATDLTNARLKIFSEGSLATAVKASCCVPLGVNVNCLNTMEGKMGYKSIIERTIHIAIGNSTETLKNKCDVYIEPPNMGDYGTFDFKKIDEIYKIGYNHAQSYKEELLKL